MKKANILLAIMICIPTLTSFLNMASASPMPLDDGTAGLSVNVTGWYIPPPVTNPPTISNVLAWNATTGTEWVFNTTGVSLTPTSLNITHADLNGDALDWYIYFNDSNVWKELASDTNAIANCTNTTTNTSFINSYDTTYNISVNITDGLYWCNETYTFDTRTVPAPVRHALSSGTCGLSVMLTENHLPVISGVSPANNSVNNTLSFTWHCDINDQDGNPFNWVIECNNTQNSSGNNEANGTKSVLLSGLANNAEYTVWVNVTDGIGWVREWFTFRTANLGTIPNVLSHGTGGLKVYIEYYEWTDWTDWWEMTLINFGEPTSFSAKNINESAINVSWAKHVNATHTYVIRKIGSTPSNITDGVLAYNDTGLAFNDSSLNVGTHYYYAAFGYNDTQVEFTDSFASSNNYTNPGTPYDFSSSGKTMSTISLLWAKGINSTKTVIVMNETGYAGYPDSLTNGTKEYNSTGTSTTISLLSDNTTYYFSAFGYNSTSSFYSDSYVSVSDTTVPSAGTPISFATTTVNDTKISMTWAKNNASDHIFIRMNTGAYPTLLTGSVIYNGTGLTYTKTGLTPAIHYYFSAWEWNGEQYSSGYLTDDNITLPQPPQDFIGNIVDTELTLSWSKGTGAVRTIIRNDTSAYPTLTTGYLIYNDTGTSKTISGITTIDYYRGWSYAVIDGIVLFSESVNIIWGGLEINAYKENNTNIAITNYTIFITNELGTETYEAINCNNPKRMDVSIVPHGANVAITVSKDGYYPRTIYKDLYENAWYVVNFYLSAKPEGGGTPGEPDYVPPSNNESSYLFVLTVVGEQYEYGTSPPIEGVKVTIKRYINATDSYEPISSLITDANGQCSVYLIPNVLYKITCNKSGFYDSTTDFIPDENIRTKTLRIHVVIPGVGHLEIFNDIIDFTAVMYNGSYILINYDDSNHTTIDTHINVYELYDDMWASIFSNTRVGEQSFTENATLINKSRTHIIELFFNNSNTFDISSPAYLTVFPIDLYTPPFTKPDFNDRINNVFGPPEAGGVSLGSWWSVITVALALVLLGAFGPFNTPVAIILSGVSILSMQGLGAILFINTANIALAAIGPVVIFIGFIYWMTKGESDNTL